jgi:hypothetical protein
LKRRESWKEGGCVCGPQGEFSNTKAKRNITNSIYGLNVEKQIPFEKTR